MKDVQYAQAVAQANQNGINELLGVSGTCQKINLDTSDWYLGSGWSAPYASPGDYYEVPKDTAPSGAIEIYVCRHCDQRHRIDTSRLDPVTVLDCLNCGAPLI